MIATLPLGQLFFFHVLLIRKVDNLVKSLIWNIDIFCIQLFGIPSVIWWMYFMLISFGWNANNRVSAHMITLLQWGSKSSKIWEKRWIVFSSLLSWKSLIFSGFGMESCRVMVECMQLFFMFWSPSHVDFHFSTSFICRSTWGRGRFIKEFYCKDMQEF